MIESIEAVLFPIVCKINEYLSNYILVFLLLGIGFWYSIKTRFVQIRCFNEGWNSVFGNLSLRGKKHDSGMSSFQALATAIAAQVGTGIIVGVAGAILTGGPGAVFWMWVISFFGMATIYAEATLAQETRIVDEDGSIRGGPVYYITTAFKGRFGKFLAGFFATAIILALGFMGCMVQSNSIGATMETAFGIPSWVIGIVLIVICAFIFLGGVQRLASVTEKVVPLMAAVFLFGGLIAAGPRGFLHALKDFSLPVSMSFRLFGALLSGALVTELVYYYAALSYVLPVIVGVMFTLLHALIQAYVLTMLVSTFYGESTEKHEKKPKAKKVKKSRSETAA